VRRGQVRQAVAVAVVLQLLGNVAGLVIGYVTGGSFSPIVVALTVTGVSVVTGLATVLLPRHAVEPEQRLPPAPPHGYAYPPRGQPRPPARGMSRVSIASAVAVVLLLCGVGGAAATWGIQKGFIAVRTLIDPDSEQGVPRLVAPVTARSGPLSITVQAVEVTSRVTKVKLLLRHTGESAVTLPVFGNAQFILAGGQTLTARGQGMINVPAGVDTVREIIFDGTPSPDARTATLTFNHVGDPSFQVDSITVPNIKLTAPDEP
jgi:hypothetical protein